MTETSLHGRSRFALVLSILSFFFGIKKAEVRRLDGPFEPDCQSISRHQAMLGLA
jgi:hypothetical protein